MLDDLADRLKQGAFNVGHTFSTAAHDVGGFFGGGAQPAAPQAQHPAPAAPIRPVVTPAVQAINQPNQQSLAIQQGMAHPATLASVHPLQPEAGGTISDVYNAVNNPHAGGEASQAVAGAVNHAGQWNFGRVAHDVGEFAKGTVDFAPKFVTDYSQAFANIGNKLAGAPQQSTEQLFGNTPGFKQAIEPFHPTGKLQQLGGSAIDLGLNAVAPAADALGERVAAHFLPDVAGELAARLTGRAIAGAPVQAAQAVAGSVGEGGNTHDVLHNAEMSALFGTGFGLLGGVEPGEVLGFFNGEDRVPPKPAHLPDHSMDGLEARANPEEPMTPEEVTAKLGPAEYQSTAGMTLDQIHNGVQRSADALSQDVNTMPPAGKGSMTDLSDAEVKTISKGALDAKEGAKTAIRQYGKALQGMVKRAVKSPAENRLFQAASEHPELEANILGQVKDPEAFKSALDQFRQFTDVLHQRIQQSGDPDIGYLQDYYPHIIDKEDPAILAKLEEMQNHISGTLGGGFFSRERIAPNIEALEKAGIPLKNGSVAEDIRDYSNAVASKVGRNELVNYVKAKAPGHITTMETAGGKMPLDNDNMPFRQPQIAGMENTLVSPKLGGKLSEFGGETNLPTAVRIVDKASQLIKRIGFEVSNFHNIMETVRYTSQELASLRVPNLIEGERVFWSPKAWDEYRIQVRPWIDFLTKHGLTLDKNFDVGGLRDALVEGKDPFHKALFERKINYYKLDTAIKESKRMGLDPSMASDNPAFEQRLRQVNNWFGGVNSGAIARSPIGRIIQRWITLAPDFSMGKVNTVGNILDVTGRNGARGLAARQVIGNVLALAVMAEVANKALNGQFISPQQAVTDPYVKTPLHNKKGRNIIFRGPSTLVGDVTHAVTNPTNFAQGHLSAPLSIAEEALTNKDYYGNPLVDPFNNPNPSGAQRLETSLESRIPIGARQGQLALQGNEPVQEALLNTLGLKGSQDPNDPAVKQATQYYTLLSKTVNGLNPNDKAAWNVVHPQTKDQSGNYVITPTVFDSSEKASVYLAHPDVLKADNQLNQALGAQGQSVDPFFTKLTPDQQQAYLEHQRMAPGGPDAENWKNTNPWYKTFEQQRASFYSTLPPADPNKPQSPVQAPSVSTQVQGLLSDYDQLTDPAQRATFLDSNPALTTYFSQLDTYTNKMRTSQGYAALKDYPTADPATSQFMKAYMAADQTGRAQMRTGDPQSYTAMNDYLAQISEYELDREASLDELQGNTPSQKYLKSAYSLGQYDITKNPDGTYTLNNGINGNPSSGSAGSKSKPLVPLPRIKYAKAFRINKPRKLRRSHINIKRAYHATKHSNIALKAGSPAKPTQVVKLAKAA